MTKFILRSTVVGAAFALFLGSGIALADDAPTTTYKFGGYAKFDAMFTDYSNGTPDGNSLMRQFYYAPQIPVSGSSSDLTTDFQARESRLNFRVDHKTAGGNSVTAFVEMDFFTHGDGNEVVSNSYSPRLRHAFIKYDNWTFGQTWSTFQDVAALPEALDFVGPAESTTFIRQSMIRYTTGNLELAVENPQTFVIGGTRDRSTVPDLIARYTFKMDGGGYVKLDGLVRSIKIQEDSSGSHADATGWGVSASTKIPFGNGSDLRAMVTYGDGVGRYIGLGFVPDGYRNVITGDIKTTETLAYFVSYRHVWNEQWRSNIMYGNTSNDFDSNSDAAFVTYDSDDGFGSDVNDTGSSIHVNLIRNILPKLDVGFEVIWGERETFRNVEVGEGIELQSRDGDFTRFMLSAKYAF